MHEIVELFRKIRVNKATDGPSLHKPLALLLALGRCFRGEHRMILFEEFDAELTEIFRTYYPAGLNGRNTHYPFGKLENDQLWEVELSDELQRTSVGHLLKGELIERRIHGGLIEEVDSTLKSNPSVLLSCAKALLDRFFEPSQHERILRSTGLKVSELREPKVEPRTEATNRHDETAAASHSTIAVRQDAMTQNSYIAYLNSLHNIGAAGANALAESQALNAYFAELYEPFPIVDDVLRALRGPRDRVVVLTGHAGDGKSTVALDILKRLRGLPPEQPLAKALEEREAVDDSTQPGHRIQIVKDMSELSAERRLQWLEDAFGEPGSWLIVSNTGPLLNSLRDFADRRLALSGIESQILEQLNRPYADGNIEEHVLSEFPKDLVIVNMTRLDNVALGARLLSRLVAHSGWSQCADCAIAEACPLLLNKRALAATGTRAEERVRWLYRRLTAYEQRLTLRQMVAHLAFALTGGMTCEEAKTAVATSTNEGIERGTNGLEQILFSEGLFGYHKGEPSARAGALRAVALVRRSVFGGPVGVDFERQLGHGEGSRWADLPETLVPLARVWASRAREAAGVRWRFAQRRLFYVFAQPRAETEPAARIYFDSFLQSPRLRDFDHWTQRRDLALSGIDKRRLRNACLRVLLETFSGFSAGQFRADQEKLYLTLRRPDRAVVQPTQLVMATLPFDAFDLRYDAALRLPLLVFQDGAIRLPLTLPLLDYIERRHAGDLGGELAQIHLAQLEWFCGELLQLKSKQKDGAEIKLLRAGIDGQVHIHRYFLDANSQTLEIDR